jgi:hypothetical protein
MRFLFAALIAALLIPGPALAAFAFVGAGADSCGTWIASRRQSEWASIQPGQWILGFLSGVGYWGEGLVDPLNSVDARAVWAWVDNYCLAHPLEDIERAGAAFITAHPH